jgi:hypothetical protein
MVPSGVTPAPEKGFAQPAVIEYRVEIKVDVAAMTAEQLHEITPLLLQLAGYSQLNTMTAAVVEE